MEEPEWRTGTLKGDDRKNGEKEKIEKESKVRSGPEGVERGSKSEKRMIEAQRKKEREREIQAEGGREEMWCAAMETVENPPPAF